MTDRETMQQALECIECCNAHGWILADYEDEVYASIDALKAALAQPEQEPTCPECKAGVLYECVACSSNNYPPKPQPPPEWEAINNIIAEYGLQAIDFVSDWKAAQRPWQGLTPEDLAQIESDEFWQVGNHMAIAMAVEDKLKERNT